MGGSVCSARGVCDGLLQEMGRTFVCVSAPKKPLAYNIAWKTIIYLLMASIIHYLERLIDFSRQAGGLVAGNEKLLAEIVWPHYWAVQIILFLLIMMYCTGRELTRVIGKKKMLRLFFGPLPLPAF